MQNNSSNKNLSLWQFLWQVIKPYKWWYLLIFQAPFLTSFYFLANNYSLKLLIDTFSIGPNVSYHQLGLPIVIFLVAQFLLDISWRISNIAEWRAEPYVRKAILLKSYDYIQYHSYRFFQNTPSGTVISKLKGILDGYDVIFASLHHTLGKFFCTVIVSVFALLLVSKIVFLFMLSWCIFMVAILLPMGLKLNHLSSESTDSKHHVIGMFSDNITNIFSLFYFAMRKMELKRASKFITDDFVPRQIKMYKYDFKLSMIGSVMFWVMLIFVFLFMIYLRKNALISTGDLTFVLLMCLGLSFDLWMFITGLNDFMKQVGDLKSSYAILATPHEQVDSPHAKDLRITQGTIRFNNVNFSYAEGKPIFHGLNLQIEAGEKIGLVGHSGAGKSSLISLLLKNFNPDAGDIFLNGNHIREITADSLRRQISLIPQDIMLFHRSIAENIGYAKENATSLEIQEAAKMANIHDFITSLPEQYDTLVGERGIKLSGGQRQRIAIARAFLKAAPIIILDEATSSLDSTTEQQIQQSINAMLDTSKATVIAIAHRLSTIRHMDRILVMDNGQIIEEGAFEQLLARDGYFKAMWDAQVNGMIL